MIWSPYSCGKLPDTLYESVQIYLHYPYHVVFINYAQYSFNFPDKQADIVNFPEHAQIELGRGLRGCTWRGSQLTTIVKRVHRYILTSARGFRDSQVWLQKAGFINVIAGINEAYRRHSAARLRSAAPRDDYVRRCGETCTRRDEEYRNTWRWTATATELCTAKIKGARI